MQARSNKQGKAHSTPKAVTFPKKNDLPHIHVDAFMQSCHQLIYIYQHNACACTAHTECTPVTSVRMAWSRV